MPRLVGARVAMLLASIAGCGDRPPTPRLDKFAPEVGYSDLPLRVILTGADFLPSWELDTASGLREARAVGFTGRVGGADGPAVVLKTFGWRGLDELSALMEPGLPAGTYPVKIRDPRGAEAVLEAGFTSLGPDLQPPVVFIETPSANTGLAPGSTAAVRLFASDGEQGRLASVRWEGIGPDGTISSGECPISPAPELVLCQFDLEIPLWLNDGDPFVLRVTATDSARAANRGGQTLSFRLQPRLRIERIAPTRGGTPGGTDVLVTGTGFLPGSRVFFGDVAMIPDGGIFIDDHTISGRAPEHAAGPVSMTLKTPFGQTTWTNAFEFQSPPSLQGIEPDTGDAAGGTVVTIRGSFFSAATRIYFGHSLSAAVALGEPALVGPDEIRGAAPPGRGRTSVWAFDPELGYSRLEDVFAWPAPP